MYSLITPHIVWSTHKIWLFWRSFFFYSILRWSVAMSTMHRQSSRIVAFLQADARPMFSWPRSASTARSQVWLGLPSGGLLAINRGRPASRRLRGLVSIMCEKVVFFNHGVCTLGRLWAGRRHGGNAVRCNTGKSLKSAMTAENVSEKYEYVSYIPAERCIIIIMKSYTKYKKQTSNNQHTEMGLSS